MPDDEFIADVEVKPLVAVDLKHGAYLKNPTYRRQVQNDLIRETHKASQIRFRIIHDDDYACCEIESWFEVGFPKLLTSLDADGIETLPVTPV
jgi:hypothetical protein